MPVVGDKPVLLVEHDFTRQTGLPLIRVTDAGTGSTLVEDRFYSDGPPPAASSMTWRIPLTIGLAPGQRDLLLDGKATNSGEPLVNKGALAYVRVLYPPVHAATLASRMSTLADFDRLNLINDASALGRAGYAPASQSLAYIAGLPILADPIVWRRAVGTIATIDAAYVPGNDRMRFRQWARGLLKPLVAKTGLDDRPGEDPNVGELRTSLLIVLARLGDDRVGDWARSVDPRQQGFHNVPNIESPMLGVLSMVVAMLLNVTAVTSTVAMLAYGVRNGITMTPKGK